MEQDPGYVPDPEEVSLESNPFEFAWRLASDQPQILLFGDNSQYRLKFSRRVNTGGIHKRVVQVNIGDAWPDTSREVYLLYDSPEYDIFFSFNPKQKLVVSGFPLTNPETATEVQSKQLRKSRQTAIARFIQERLAEQAQE